MTPPLPLAEVRERMARCELGKDALPLGRCETCREWTRAETGLPYGTCSHGVIIPPFRWCVPPDFGCIRHAPAPPAAGEETR